MNKYTLFLRGINVGGHHKVPMADLRAKLESLGFERVITLLNSGNVLFEAAARPSEEALEAELEKAFGFPIPCLVRSFDSLRSIYESDPFKGINVTKDTRLYLSFLKSEVKGSLDLPWSNPSGSFKILGKTDQTVFSVLDVSESKTVKAMEIIEKSYPTAITTRNWNTLVRLIKKGEGL